jgi:hypothetical protein
MPILRMCSSRAIASRKILNQKWYARCKTCKYTNLCRAFNAVLNYHCFFRTQVKASALTLASTDDPIFNYKEWACGVGGPEPWEDNASPLTSRINTGVTFFRSTESGVAMARRWLEKASGCFSNPDQGCDDQTSFNALAAHKGDINPVMDGRHGTVSHTRKYIHPHTLQLTFFARFNRRNPSKEEKAAFTGANSRVNVAQ